VSIPIIVVGKIDYKLGDRIIREGKADFIGMTRPLQADPEMPNKLAAGRPEDIAPCTACGTCLDQSLSMARRCRINAAMGTENYDIEPATARKKVVVVGGGPAGLEAARVAALRGHEVTIYEKSSRLGGLLSLAALIKGLELENLPDMVRYFEVQLEKLGVKRELNQEFTASMADTLKPDVVILATGGTLTVPDIRGIDKANVVTTPDLHRRVKPFLRLFGPRLLGWLTRRWLPIGKRVIVIGGGLHGCEAAEFLIKRGRDVTIVETSDTIGEGMLDFRLGLTLDWFGRKGVNVITGVRDMEITDKGLVIIDRENQTEILEADSIMPTSPLVPNTGLKQSLEGKVRELYIIGDCNEPRMIVDAIADAWGLCRGI
jgi:2,4-dienoyl-CoA reductase (NADPH2)